MMVDNTKFLTSLKAQSLALYIISMLHCLMITFYERNPRIFEERFKLVNEIYTLDRSTMGIQLEFTDITRIYDCCNINSTRWLNTLNL